MRQATTTQAQEACEKSVSVTVGAPVTQPKLSLDVKVGTGKHGERLYSSLASQFGYTSKPTYAIVSLKQASANPKAVEAIRNAVQIGMSMASDMFYSESELHSIFGIDVKEFDGKVHIGAWVNLEAEELEMMSEQFSIIDSFLQSPVDQSIEAKLALGNGVAEFV
jgi:hypothetical protein